MANALGLTSTNTVMSLFNRHLQKRSEKSLRDTVVLYELCDKHPLPGRAGKTIFVPKHIARDSIVALTEGTILGTSATSAHFYSATVAGYGDARSYSDFLVMIHEIPTMISDDVAGMTRDAGLFIDRLLANQFSGAGTYVAADGSTPTGSVKSTTQLKQSFLFSANTTLKSNKAPTFNDGSYAGVFHPRQTYDLFVATSGGMSQLGATPRGGSFMENTELGARKLEMATIGKLGNVRIFENTNAAPDKIDNSGAVSAEHSGYHAYVFGPGAVGAVDLATARLKTFIKPVGSAGASDPINQKMTAGVKFYFAAIAKDTTNRIVHTASGKTL